MDGGGVDHDAEDAGVEGQPGDGDQVVVGGVGGSAQVGAGGRRGVAEVGEEALGDGDGLGASRRGRPGRGRAAHRRGRRRGRCRARRAATARWRRPRGRRAPRRSAACVVDPRSSTRTSRPPGAVGRAWSPVASVSSGVPSGLTPTPSRVVRVSLAHTASSGSPSRSRPALRSTPAAAFSQSARVAAGPCSASASVPWSGSSSVGLRQAALQGILRGHDSHSRSGRRAPSHTL